MHTVVIDFDTHLYGFSLFNMSIVSEILELAIGRDTAENVMVGCLVHYGRSCQRFTVKVSTSLTQQFHKLSREAFCKIARAIPNAKTKAYNYYT